MKGTETVISVANQVQFTYCSKQYRLDSYTTPQDFLALYKEVLECQEAQNNLILGLSHEPGLLKERYPEVYYLALYEHESLVALAMRTPPHNLLLGEIDGNYEAAAALAYACSLRGDNLPGVLGGISSAKSFSDAYQLQTGVAASLHMEQLIHTLHTLEDSITIEPGTLECADSRDIPTLLQWMNEFQEEALQTSLSPAHQQRVLEDIQKGQLYLWKRPDGQAVSMLQKTRPTKHAYCISYVYTPQPERQKGYARSAVYTLSKEILNSHEFALLYTDKGNPASNSLYFKLGYRVCYELSLYTFQLQA